MVMSDLTLLTTIGTVKIWEIGGALWFQAGLQVSADGAPNAYHPPTDAHPETGCPPGLDDLRNAGKPGNWWGIATDGSGHPFVQTAHQPFPGFFVSTTALMHGPTNEPRSYVDAWRVPYFVLPSGFGCRCHLGDLGVVFHGEHSSGAVYADVGPSGKIGEGSVALLVALGIYGGMMIGHDAEDVEFLLFPGSRAAPPWPQTLDGIHFGAEALFNSWGGPVRLAALRASLKA